MKIKSIIGGVCAPQGFLAGGARCGIQRNCNRKDLALIVSAVPCRAAAVYTKNTIVGASVVVTKEHLSDGKARAIVCHSGNANVYTAKSIEYAHAVCDAVGHALGISPTDVILASTGIVGEELNVEPILQGIPILSPTLDEHGGSSAALAILTDIQPKELAVEFMLGGHIVHIGAIAKGDNAQSNMATTLALMTTDANITAEMLQKALDAVAQNTYHMISIDNEFSPNDMVCILANGMAGNAVIDSETEEYQLFCEALNMISLYAARLIAGEGLGATKLLECAVTGAPTQACARVLAKSVATSNRFKVAMYRGDANGGSVLRALGNAGTEFCPDNIEVCLSSVAGRIRVCEHGVCIPFSKEIAAQILKEDEIRVEIQLNDGECGATAWGCDLTNAYIIATQATPENISKTSVSRRSF